MSMDVLKNVQVFNSRVSCGMKLTLSLLDLPSPFQTDVLIFKRTKEDGRRSWLICSLWRGAGIRKYNPALSSPGELKGSRAFSLVVTVRHQLPVWQELIPSGQRKKGRNTQRDKERRPELLEQNQPREIGPQIHCVCAEVTGSVRSEPLNVLRGLWRWKKCTFREFNPRFLGSIP